VSETVTDIARERQDVYTSHRVTAVQGGATKTVHAESEAGKELAVETDEVLVVLGRRPNSDALNLDAAGIETDDDGFVVTDDSLATVAENVWAQGDVADNAMFEHSGDYETEHVVANAVHGEARELALSAMPHTIFTEP
jgi:dihydrolipoamide dehydrogenase